MAALTLVASVCSLGVSIITIVKVVVGVNTTLTKLSCSIDSLTKTLDKTAQLQELQRAEIESIKIQLAKLS